MKITVKDPPRIFHAGQIAISDCASIHLLPDEQVTLTVESGAEHDVCRKSWGFYATASVNGRLSGFGWRTVLTRNTVTGRRYIMLVEADKLNDFQAYLDREAMVVEIWLDSDAAPAG